MDESNDTTNDAWIEQLEHDLLQLQDINRNVEEARAHRVRLIDAKALDFFKGLSKLAKKAAERLRLEFEEGRILRDGATHPTDYSFVVTRRNQFARLEVDLNAAAQSAKATYTRSLAMGNPNEDEEIFDIRLTPEDDLCLKPQTSKHPVSPSEALNRMFRATFLLH